MSKRIVISGYYGFNNTGDEAVLRGMLAALRQAGVDAKITVLSADPSGTLSAHPVDSAVHRYSPLQVIKAIRSADLVISGGGSLLQDVTSARSLQYYLLILRLARILRRKIMIFAQGIGPLISESSRKSVAAVLNNVDYITVRDRDSLELLRSIGVTRPTVDLTADPALLVEPDLATAEELLARMELTDRPIIGVALRPWEKAGEWFRPAAEGIRTAAREIGASILVIPMQLPGDADIWTPEPGEFVAQTQMDVSAVKGLVSRCGLLVGMRLHSLIFAAGEEVPFVALDYDPKVASFADITGQPRVDIASLDAGELSSIIIDAWSGREQRRTAMREVALELRKQVAKAAEAARELLSQRL